MYRNLFIEYLQMVLPKDENGNANSKTINDYLDGLSGRIAPYAKRYYSSFVDIFELDFDNAEKIRTLLLKDKEFLEHCKGSNNVQITSLNNYSRFIDYVNANKSTIVVNAKGIRKDFAKEGEPYECHSIEYKRNRELRNSVARERNYTCEICGVNLVKVYGPIAKEFIEVHHKDPLHKGGRDTTKEDLECVCPNCHSMLHRLNPILSPEDLKLRMKIVRSKS